MLHLSCSSALLALAQSTPPSTPQAQQPSSPAQTQTTGSIPEIIVTGTLEESGVPLVPLSYPASRDVLGPDEVRRVGARDMNDLVQYLPAVSTRPYNGAEGSAPSFSMRGLPDDGLTEYILPLIDGVPANPMPYGWTAFSFFPLITEQVYAIDLIRGGQAVRYSPNNVAGAINLITPPIPDHESYELRSTLGSYGYLATLFSAGNDDGRFGYLLTLGERHGDGYRVDGEFENLLGDLKLRWTYADDDWLAWRLSYFEDQHQAPGGLTLAQYEQDRFANGRPEGNFDGFRAVTDVVRHVGDGAEYTEYFAWYSQTRRNLHHRSPHFGAPTDIVVEDDDAFNANAGVRGTRHIDALGDAHELYWGARASQELIPNNTTTSEPIGGGAESELADIDFSLTALSAHLDDTYRPNDELTLVAGVRAEYVPTIGGDDQVSGRDVDEDFFDLLPAASASYRLTDSLAVFANYQQSFRSPQVWGLDTTVSGPDHDLDFEHGDSWEAGLRADTRFGLNGSLSSWHVNFQDVAFFTTTGFYENVGDIDSNGVDLVLGYDFGASATALDGLSVQGSLTWQDSELVNAADPANDGNEVPYAWEHKAAWSVQYLSADDWRLALGGTHVGSSFSDEANTASENPDGTLGVNPARTVWDAQVGRDLDWGKRARVRFSIGATNLFDADWFVHSAGGSFGGGKVAGPPQQLYASLQVNL